VLRPLSFPWLFLYLDIFGYVGNGKSDLSDFGAGVWLDRENTLIPFPDTIPKDIVNFDVTGFVNERVSNAILLLGLAFVSKTWATRIAEVAFITMVRLPWEVLLIIRPV
jgi:uncharacterized Tic20 family protein